MAYVVARPRGRFEIRESLHTPKGPRARSLANFAHLSDEVLDSARVRASRPFDAEAVRASARRAGVPIRRRRRRQEPGTAGTPGARHFVESSRRMAASLGTRPPTTGTRRDPGDALIDLLGFVAQVKAFAPDRAAEPLGFPPLAKVAHETAERQATTERRTP